MKYNLYMFQVFVMFYFFQFYYFAIIEDFILRILWVIGYIVTENKIMSSLLWSSIQGPLEVFRRFVWNFFRLENEHLNNCGKFRAVRDISVAPIDSSDQAQMLRMMDDMDGVFNRRPRKDKKKEDKKSLLKNEALYSPTREDNMKLL